MDLLRQTFPISHSMFDSQNKSLYLELDIHVCVLPGNCEGRHFFKTISVTQKPQKAVHFLVLSQDLETSTSEKFDHIPVSSKTLQLFPLFIVRQHRL